MKELFIISSWILPFGYVWLHNSDTGVKLLNLLNPKNIMKFIFDMLIAWFLGLFMPILMYIHAVVFFIVVDFIIGVIAAIINKEKFSFPKSLRVVLKPVAFILLLAFLYQGQLMLKIPNVQLGDMELGFPLLITGFVWVTELKSIADNIKKAFGYDIGAFLNDNIPFLKYFKKESKDE